MYTILIRLMLVAALGKLGLSLANVSQQEVGPYKANQLKKSAALVIEIAWKPISFFPEECKRFRK